MLLGAAFVSARSDTATDRRRREFRTTLTSSVSLSLNRTASGSQLVHCTRSQAVEVAVSGLLRMSGRWRGGRLVRGDKRSWLEA
jgi:hypothetical protein